MTALAGLPLVLLVGLVADLSAGAILRLVGRGKGAPAVGAPLAPLRALRRRGAPRPVGALQAMGAVLAGTGGGIVGAAVLGAVPGPLAVVALSLIASSAGLRLCRSDAPTRTRATAAVRDLGAGAVFEALAVVALVGGFLRWRVPGLESIRGAQAVLGPGVAVGSAAAVAAVVLAALVLALAGGIRAGHPGLHAPGRTIRVEESLLLALCRWSVLGSVALLAAALVAGPQIGPVGGSSPVRVLSAWVPAVVVAAAASGLASRVGAGGVRAAAAVALGAAVTASLVLGAL